MPIVAPLGQFAGIDGSLIVTAFQSASGLVNIITPTAAVVMGGLAFGNIPYDRWVRYVWKLILIKGCCVCYTLRNHDFLEFPEGAGVSSHESD